MLAVDQIFKTSVEITFSRWFLLKRREKGYTQSQIAEVLGVSDQTISNWERGKSIPVFTLNQMDLLCKEFDCNFSEIPKN